MLEELLREVRQLAEMLTGETPIEYDFQNDAPDDWKCSLCWTTVRVVFTGPSHSMFSPCAPCNFAESPHTEECPVTYARRILELLGKNETWAH